MTVELNAKSPYISAIDRPFGLFIPSTIGDGSRGICKVQQDFLQVDTALFSAVGNYGKLLRLPADAVISKLEIFSDVPLDTNATSTLAFDIGLCFSNGPSDGTPQDKRGLVQTTVGFGATPGTNTTFAAYSNPNKLFGNFNLATAAQNLNNKKIPASDVTLNGVTSQYSLQQILSQPLVNLFNFLDGRGAVSENLGFLDLYIYCTTVAATPAAGNLGARAFYTD
jgi:hypothetical protein